MPPQTSPPSDIAWRRLPLNSHALRVPNSCKQRQTTHEPRHRMKQAGHYFIVLCCTQSHLINKHRCETEGKPTLKRMLTKRTRRTLRDPGLLAHGTEEPLVANATWFPTMTQAVLLRVLCEFSAFQPFQTCSHTDRPFGPRRPRIQTSATASPQDCPA